MARFQAAAAAALMLSCCAAMVVAQSARAVTNVNQLYNAIIDQSVTSIGLAYNGASLAPYSNQINNYVRANGAFQLQRSVTLSSALPNGGRASFDFAYLGALITLAPGTTFTFSGLSLARMQALRAPVGIFAASPGATVVVQNCINNQQVCWPHEGAQYLFLNVFQRPAQFPGAQSAVFCAPNTEASCKQYTFNDVAFTVNPSIEFGSGEYSLRYLNTRIRCQSYPDPLPVCDTLTTDPWGCLANVYDPANSRTVCPTCSCINSCRAVCNQIGIAQNPGC